MDASQFKDGKRTRKYSLITNFTGIALLLAIAIAVLLYGRIEPIDRSATQDKVADDNTVEQLSDEQREVLRQKYIAKMSIYENEIKDQIEKLNLTAWSPEDASALQTQEKEAIKAFSANRFGSALTHLDTLFAKVSELQSSQRQNFEIALRNAQQAFTAGQIEQASSAIADALRYLPENSEALLLKSRIAKMADIAELMEKADIAHIENNLNEEINILSNIIKLDPHRNELIERHRLLLEKQRQQTLDDLLMQTSQALNNKNITAARSLLSRIKQIDAKHPSLSVLTDKTRQIQTEISYQDFVSKARDSLRNDDWQTAENYFNQALMIFPDNQEIKYQQQLAAQINKYTNIIKQALTKPERLADDQISAAMRQIADDSAELTEHSAQLQHLVEHLSIAIAKMSKPVAVTIHSDEQTYISVIGVGIIGKVSQYKLKEGLKPGTYLFKGERKGYKDKLVEVHIKPEQAKVVRVVCDETI